MDKLITFLKKEFPNDALEIQECIELLNQCIGGSRESIKSAFNQAIDKKNYDKIPLLTDFLATIDSIQYQLDEYSDMLQIDEEVEESIVEKEISESKEKLIPDYNSLRVDQNIPHTLYDVYTHKRPAGFELFGQRYDAKEWKDVFVQTCEVLASKDLSLFRSFVEDKTMQGRKVPYFCIDTKVIRAPRKIKGTDVHVMTNMSANQIRNVIERMLRKYNIRISDYKIYLKADYTSLHE
ncbi:hypothetical protein [Paradesulfitobacterium ferrireducens]|uniref:hypothetical protein n=1 Tax=Paradesulfitobacterium ferrireducens TaxID=2816476 RepID=UPI001A8DF006|nr:hypothetical protein [Paradesulfitobacterium ferrireducens]